MQRCARTRRKCAHSRQKKFVCPFVGLHCGCVPPLVKICVSVRWGKLWVRPPLCENMCVRSLGYIVGASPPLCVHSIGRQSSLDPCMLPTPLCAIFLTHETYGKSHILGSMLLKNCGRLHLIMSDLGVTSLSSR